MISNEESNSIISEVKHWIQKTIIGFNFCPFAKREFDKETIRYRIIQDETLEEKLQSILDEIVKLDNDASIETSILIIPQNLESFFDYLDFVEFANELLIQEDYEGIYQIASFHPDYCFDDTTQDDPANYTNRSPYPILHLLREASLEKVLDRYKNPEDIPENNIKKARELGVSVFKEILTKKD